MREHNIETRLAKLHIDVCVAERIASYFHFILVGKCGESRLVIRGVVLGVIIAVDAKLESQSGNAPEKIQVGVHRNIRQRNHRAVRRLLICYPIVPVQYSEFEVLLKSKAEHLHAAAVLAHG